MNLTDRVFEQFLGVHSRVGHFGGGLLGVDCGRCPDKVLVIYHVIHSTHSGHAGHSPHASEPIHSRHACFSEALG
jgi:hypothetical protein